MPLFQGGGGMNAALSSAPTSWHTCHLAHAQNGLCRWNGSGTDSQIGSDRNVVSRRFKAILLT